MKLYALWPLILFCISLPAQAAFRVSLDPGHGGSDNGAVHDSTREADIVLSISKKVFKLLEKDSHFKVQLLRNSNSELALDQRVKMAEQFSADLLVSIHANAHPNHTASGAEFYIQNQLPVDEETLFLAHHEVQEQQQHHEPKQGDIQSIIFDLKKNHKVLKSYHLGNILRKNWVERKHKMIRQGPFYVLSQPTMPSVLIEVGYLSHPQERAKLKKSSYQDFLAQRIYMGLKEYAKNQ